MEERDKQNKEMLDEASDVMKDVAAAPISPASKVGKLIKVILKKIWQETDPGEKPSKCSEK